MRQAIVAALLAVLAATGAQAQDWQKGSETTEAVGQILSGTSSGIEKFGKIGTVLKDLDSGSGVGPAMQQSWNKVAGQMRETAFASVGSAPLKLASKALWWNDVADGVAAPLVEGDGRGAVSGAVNVAVNSTVVTVGTALATWSGAVIGTMLLPGAGTAAGLSMGAMVGGAVGTVAGGFISSIAFDRYGKAYVAKGVEGVIAALIDVAPLDRAMQARHEAFYANASPELRAVEDNLSAVSEGFGNTSVELIGPGSAPYIIMKKPAESSGQQGDMDLRSKSVPPAAVRQKPAQGTGLLANATRIEIFVPNYLQTCTIRDGQVSCTGNIDHGSNGTHFSAKITFSGRLTGNRMEGNAQILLTSTIPGCTYTGVQKNTEAYDLSAGGALAYQRGQSTATPTGKSGGPDCKPQAMVYPPQKGAGTWKMLP